jgi:acyl-coenzyme A thioesterase PaaI-like protein
VSSEYALSQAALEVLLDEHAPRWRTFSRITALTHRAITISLRGHDDLLRSGGTLSGPAMMTLADRAAYYLTLAVVAPRPDAVTASLHIHFLVRPRPEDVRATATLLLAGTRLAISVVEIHAGDERVAHATVTYALPTTS